MPRGRLHTPTGTVLMVVILCVSVTGGCAYGIPQGRHNPGTQVIVNDQKRGPRVGMSVPANRAGSFLPRIPTEHSLSFAPVPSFLERWPPGLHRPLGFPELSRSTGAGVLSARDPRGLQGASLAWLISDAPAFMISGGQGERDARGGNRGPGKDTVDPKSWS